MKKIRITFIIILLLTVCNLCVPAADDTMNSGVFGKVSLYFPEGSPKSLVLFFSGDGGWNFGVVGMAKRLANEGAMVAGIGVQRYVSTLKSQDARCYYPASDLEELSLTLQKKYKFPQYLKPLLIGYSSGSSFAYGALAQAPANTFRGAIAVGFCPELETDKPLCNGNGLKSRSLGDGKGFYLEASKKLTAPFIILQGESDKVCPYTDIRRFIGECDSAELVTLPGVGHYFTFPGEWSEQFIKAYQKVVAAPSYTDRLNAGTASASLKNLPQPASGLPLTVIPTFANDSLPLIFMISGDGGWTNFDHSLAWQLAQKGIPVIGLDAQKYFWKAKTPDETVRDISAAILQYLSLWNKKSFAIGGYSFGADIVPFIATRLDAELRSHLKGVYMVSPSEKADFEIHISDMLSLVNKKETFDVLAETKKLDHHLVHCLFGNDEDPALRNRYSQTNAQITILPGSHHFNNDFVKLAEPIWKGCLDFKINNE